MGYESSEFLLYLLPLLHSNCSISLLLATSVGMFVILAVLRWTSRGGCAWAMLRSPNTIPGPRGYPVLGSLLDMGSLAHRRLSSLAVAHRAESLMSLSLGSTRLVISSKPGVARDILNSSSFADRPLKQSAQELMFGRAIGFAPYGEYWRGLRRIAANHLFSPRRIAAHEGKRQELTLQMLNSVSNTMATDGHVTIRKFLQHASLNSVLSSVFGRTFAFGSHSDTTASLLHEMVREGFELLGAFNWSDHLPILRPLDPACIQARCEELVPKVHSFVQNIIDEHRRQHRAVSASESDFVDVLLSLNGEDKLQDQDMVAVLWEMIFRGTDTTAILTEWILAELVLHPEIQKRVHQEIDEVVARTGRLTDLEISRMPLLQAVTKETLRVHPPGPLLSWARLATEDVVIAGHHVPAGTTAMVNMWAITHDPSIWENPESFNPDRFLGAEFDIKGTDLRLAPFGAGRRVCPGRALGVATVGLWLGKLLERFEFLPVDGSPVDLSEVLKLSCEMVNPLVVRAVERQTRSKA